MHIFKQLNYLFTKKLKIELIGMLLIIFGGAIAELLGVSIILPIVNLAMVPDSVNSSELCLMIMAIFRVDDYNSVLLILIFATIVIYVCKNVYLSWMAFMMNSFSKKTKQYYSIKLMEAYLKQPYAYFLDKNTSEILRSINSDTVNFYAVITNGLQVISQGITGLLIVGFLASTNFVMTVLVGGLLGGCALVIILGMQKKIRRMGREFQKLSSKIILYAKQTFEGIKEVKVLSKERFFMDEFQHAYDVSSELERKYNLLNIIPKYFIETICIAGIMSYLASAIILGGNLAVLIPQLAVFAVAAFKLLPSVNALYASVSNIIFHKASVDVIYHDLREVENITTVFELDEKWDDVFKFNKNIEVKNVSFSYQNSQIEVLKDINLEIRKGESVAFIGESGGGKSTLVDIILGLLSPKRGEILVDGKNIVQNERAWRYKIGYIPQMIFLLDDSIRRNIAFGVSEDKVSDDRIWEVLKEAQLDEFVNKLEEGLDTEVGEAGTRLSGGQRQRIGIARALYHNPDILVFDEATSALDNETEKEVMEAINALHGTKTMIMIAHRLSTIENCEHVYRVGGQKVEQVR